MSQLFASLLPEAIKSDAVAKDFWLPYQRSGEFLRAARIVIAGGNWWFGLKTLQIDVSSQSTSSAATGWPYRFAIPSDWLRTQALFVSFGGTECPFDIRETAEDWSTATPAFSARYLSTDALDSAKWPEAVTKAVAAYLDWQGETDEDTADKEKPQEEQLDVKDFQSLLAAALEQYSIPEDKWLRFQLDGSYNQAVVKLLEQGRWRFAIKTVTLSDPNNPTNSNSTPPHPGAPNSVSDGSVSPGYSCRVLKPNDLLRTIEIYKSWSDGLLSRWTEIDYRDELDAFHLNWTPVVLRYVSRIGLDATRWPANFRDAVLAWLEYSEASADPKMAGIAKVKFELFKSANAEAQILDDERDVPRVLGGRFVAGRYGRGNFVRKQGWPPTGF
jgi:hypothetical protein